MTNRDVFELLLKKMEKHLYYFCAIKEPYLSKNAAHALLYALVKNALVFRKLKKFHPFSHFQNYCK